MEFLRTMDVGKTVPGEVAELGSPAQQVVCVWAAWIDWTMRFLCASLFASSLFIFLARQWLRIGPVGPPRPGGRAGKECVGLPCCVRNKLMFSLALTLPLRCGVEVG